MKQTKYILPVLLIGLLLLTGCEDKYDYSYKGLPSSGNGQIKPNAKASASSSPVSVHSTVEKAQDEIGFAFAVPSSLPANYTLDEISVVNDEDTCFAQMDYKKDSYSITYRVSQVTEMLNSDRNTYAQEKNISVLKTDITCLCNNDTIFVAIWQKDGCYYCIMSDEGLDAATLSILITSIQ